MQWPVTHSLLTKRPVRTMKKQTSAGMTAAILVMEEQGNRPKQKHQIRK
jgi:hypothetical protein